MLNRSVQKETIPEEISLSDRHEPGEIAFLRVKMKESETFTTVGMDSVAADIAR